jgi:dienelactone hydrolase
MKKIILFLFLFPNLLFADPIKHDKKYPDGKGPFPAVIILHTSGGYNKDVHFYGHGKFFLDSGYAIYAPDFFSKHGLTPKTRERTWSKYLKNIEQELSEIVNVMKSDPKIDKEKIFAVGFSNGGFWATYLAGTSQVKAGSTHYGVWGFKKLNSANPLNYLNKNSSPILILHPKKDTVQKMRWVEPRVKKALKINPKNKAHFYDKGGHNWSSTRYKNGIGYNKEVYIDAMNRTVNFFNSFLQ